MENRTTTVLRGHRLRSASEGTTKTRTYGVGRTCIVEGCGTRLSAYNPSRTCALHEGMWREDNRRGSRRSAPREEVTRRCSFEGCGREFTSANPAKRYCCDACRMKAFQARVMAARRVSDLSDAQRAS
ncbi:MAG: hypothetical protein R2826_09275 [Thermoleophilia bacterium]